MRLAEVRVLVPASAGLWAIPWVAGASAGLTAWLEGIARSADASVWVDGRKTTSTGTSREFVSPPLTPGHDYTYLIEGRWTENGKTVDRSKRVPVQAGQRVNVNLME